MKSNSKENTEWFEDWFDSPYYHMLYKNRDDNEAKEFISNLVNLLSPSKNSLILDVACGKGRHSRYLNSLGFNVDGFDLSKNSINIAKQYESKHLHFYVNDIRNPLKLDHYKIAFNLFTSFGYFSDKEDNQLALNSIAQSLTKEGLLILDFMNCNKVITQLGKGKREIKTIDNIDFEIVKSYKDGYITKDINFSDKKNIHHFHEKVKAISLYDFKLYFDRANLKIEATFGDYKLNPFDETNSDRLIFIARKS